MKQKQKQGAQSLHNMSRGERDDEDHGKLSDGKKLLLTFMVLIPCIICFAYGSGMWSVKMEDGIAMLDRVDDFSAVVGVFFGVFAIIIINLFL